MTCPGLEIATDFAARRAVPSLPSRTALTASVDRAVAMAFRVRMASLRGPTRGAAQVALARQVAMYLAHVELGLSFGQVSQAYGRTRTTVARACRRVEDLRGEDGFDRTMVKLERGLRAARVGEVLQ